MQYLFGDYALDPDRRELTRHAEAVAIGPKVFDLLLMLLVVGFVSVVFLPVYVLVAGVFVSLVQAHALREIRRRHGDVLEEPVDEGGRL